MGPKLNFPEVNINQCFCSQVPEIDGVVTAHRENCLWVARQDNSTEFVQCTLPCMWWSVCGTEIFYIMAFGGPFVVWAKTSAWASAKTSFWLISPPSIPSSHKKTKTLANKNSSFGEPLHSDYLWGMGTPTFLHFIGKQLTQWKKKGMGTFLPISF